MRYVNISIESFDPTIYETCRKNGKYDRFVKNLETMVYYFSKNKNSPAIRYITLASTLNKDEVQSIVEKCSKKFHASEHEVRYFWSSESNKGWIKDHSLSSEQWGDLKRTLSQLPYKICYSDPRNESKESTRNGYVQKILWLRSDGELRIEYGKYNYIFDINKFDNLRVSLQKELKKLL